MATIYDVNTNKLLESAAAELEKSANLKAPDWAGFVKTGPAKQRPPISEKWWQIRAASILRAIYKSKGPIGVQKLRIRYGSKKNRGHKTEKFYRASGKIIRLIVQQLEKEELIKQTEVGVHKGRIITPKGKSLLDKIASKIQGTKPAKKPEIKEEKDAKKSENPEAKEVKKEEKKPKVEKTKKEEHKK